MHWQQSLFEWLRAAWPNRLRSRKQPLGARGEAAAAKFLQRLGYKIVARGERDSLGEIDLIAVDGRTVVFVEVKTRESADHGHPSEAVDLVKQQRLTRLALGFLKRRRLLDYPARFDIVAITWPAGKEQPLIEHIPSAFDAVGFKGHYS